MGYSYTGIELAAKKMAPLHVGTKLRNAPHTTRYKQQNYKTTFLQQYILVMLDR
jgi:hypothetical protein